MNRIVTSSVFIFLLAALSFTHLQPKPVSPLVLSHVTVIDATGAPAKPDMTLIIAGDRILALSPTGTIQLPENAQVIDAAGKFLIPGLWDMHVHLEEKDQFLPLCIANGVTGVRDMGGSQEQFELIKQWRKQIAERAFWGPRIVTPGVFIDGSPPTFDGSIAVANEKEATQIVNSLKQQGADFIKIFDLLPRQAYFAIADEAKRQHLPFAGHTPLSVGAIEASDAGQKSMEHLLGIMLACSSRGTELRKQLTRMIQNADDRFSVVARRLFFAPPEELLKTYSDKKASALFARFAKNKTWQCPTLVLWRNEAFINNSSITNDARLRYVPQARRETWTRNYYVLKPLADADFAVSQKFYRKYVELVSAMHQAGVKFIAGTDAYNPYVFPGFSLHDELAQFVQTGFTPMEALQSATINAAQYLGLADSLGTVEKGKIADLVLLDANPLQDVNNTRQIAAVIIGGEYIGRRELQKMLDNVELATSKIAKISR